MDTAYREPVVGLWFWWRGDGNPKIVRSFRVERIEIDGSISMSWNVDAGYVYRKCDLTGKVAWTKEEWDKAWNATECCVYQNPVRSADLPPDKGLCPCCCGTRWEQMKDLEYTPCVWCNFTGVRNIITQTELANIGRSSLPLEMPKRT